jgi:serine/threonine protein kinase
LHAPSARGERLPRLRYIISGEVALESGTRLGPYEVVSPIGAGGMGEVYRARDTRLGRIVALKILPEEFAHNEKLKTRFGREARAISALNHPNICALYDVGDSYLVMEYCEGETLAHRIAAGALPVDEVLRYGLQIADALDRAHRQRIIHRDLKPSNVMLTAAGVKLLDFGLAKEEQEVSEEATTADLITGYGMIVGTVPYMAPEVLRGKARRHAERRLCAGPDPLRDGQREEGVRGRHPSGRDGCDSGERARARHEAQPEPASGPGSADTRLSGEGPR